MQAVLPGFLQSRKLRQGIDMDQNCRLGQPEIHGRHETLAAGEKTRLFAIFGLQRQGLLEGARGNVPEGGGFHVWRKVWKGSPEGVKIICIRADRKLQSRQSSWFGMPNILSAWANIGRGFRASVCQYFSMPTRTATSLRMEGQSTVLGPALATPLHAVEPMRAPDETTRESSAVGKPGALAVSARGISLTFQTAD